MVVGIVYLKLTPIGSEGVWSTCKSTFERAREGSRLRCSPLPDPPKSTPSADHGKSLNPTFPPSLPPSHTHRRLSIHRLFSASHCGPLGSVGRGRGRSRCGHPSIQFMRRNRERARGEGEGGRAHARVYRVNLDILHTCSKGQTRLVSLKTVRT